MSITALFHPNCLTVTPGNSGNITVLAQLRAGLQIRLENGVQIGDDDSDEDDGYF